MPRPSTEAVAAAIRVCRGLALRSEQGSAFEALLAAWRLRQRGLTASVANVDRVVVEMFGLRPAHPQQGRVYLFKDFWGPLANAGRSTIWNVTTRQNATMARSLFLDHDHPGKGVWPDIRGGVDPMAAFKLNEHLFEGKPTEDRLPWRALAAVLLRNSDLSDDADARTQLRDFLGTPGANGTVDPLDDRDLALITNDEPLGVPLLAATSDGEFDPDALPDDVLPPIGVEVPRMTTEAVAGEAFDIVGDVVVDPRVERMLENAVRTYRAVLLVGPPGSGKNTLLKRLISKVQQQPGLIGLSRPPGLPLTRTPDESWTSFELVGGQAPSADGLRYSSGAVLDALREDRWLLLDETNRADMDKIFGALLTWLSMDPVELGTLQPGQPARVTLGWNLSDPLSTVTPPEGLAADAATTTEVAFKAGNDWRLLGTYNPQDAQRVFRFGVALSRRFAIVPVPPLDPAQFAQLLEQQQEGRHQLPEALVARLVALYRAHFVDPATQLGPAVFLRMVEYVITALRAQPIEGPSVDADTTTGADGPDHGDVLQTGDAQLADEPAMPADTEPQTGSAEEQVAAHDGLLDQLLAEAYLVRVGKYLSTYDPDTFRSLGQRITTTTALSTTEWDWVSEYRVHLG